MTRLYAGCRYCPLAYLPNGEFHRESLDFSNHIMHQLRWTGERSNRRLASGEYRPDVLFFHLPSLEEFFVFSRSFFFLAAVVRSNPCPKADLSKVGTQWSNGVRRSPPKSFLYGGRRVVGEGCRPARSGESRLLQPRIQPFGAAMQSTTPRENFVQPSPQPLNAPPGSAVVGRPAVHIHLQPSLFVDAASPLPCSHSAGHARGFDKGHPTINGRSNSLLPTPDASFVGH